MKFKEIENSTKTLKDKLVTNFEYHFNKFLLQDFYEDGWESDIDKFDEYLYFDNFSEKVNHLLFNIEELYPYNTIPDFDSYFNNLPDDVKEIQIELISLKRLIDSKSLKIINERTNELINGERSTSILINLNINRDKFIQTLYNLLFENKLIAVNSETFNTHFDKQWTRAKWLGTEIQITTLVSNLIENKYLDAETQNFKYKIISSHFLNKKGKPFNEKQLGAVYSEKKAIIPTDDIIFKIITEMSAIFN